MARPTKLTPDLQAKIAGAIAAGNYQETACQLAGIAPSTFYLWMQKGEEGKKPYSEFLEAIKKAEAASEAKRVQQILKAADTDWRAAMTYLERRYPERWGRRERVSAEIEHSGEVVKREEHYIEQTLTTDPESVELLKQLYRRHVAMERNSEE